MVPHVAPDIALDIDVALMLINATASDLQDFTPIEGGAEITNGANDLAKSLLTAATTMYQSVFEALRMNRT